MRTTLRAISILLVGTGIGLQAQTPLPYATGFDNAAQQLGWQQFRTGELSLYDWGYGGFGAPSPPTFLHHDYPVGGTANDTVRDWFVSPLFNFAQGASLALKVNVYSITGSSTPVDELKIILLTGSNNPALATTVVELADLTDSVSSSSAFIDIPAVAVPPTAGNSYIAFKYQATDNWFTIGMDDIAITSTVGMAEPGGPMFDVLLYPNPAEELVSFRSGVSVKNAPVIIKDTSGREVLRTHLENGNVDVSSLKSGVYMLLVQCGDAVISARFIRR